MDRALWAVIMEAFVHVPGLSYVTRPPRDARHRDPRGRRRADQVARWEIDHTAVRLRGLGMIDYRR